MSNIMKNEEGTHFFVDWENSIHFEPRAKKKRRCRFCHIAYVFMLSKLFVSHNEMNLKFSQESRQSIMNIIDEETKLIRLKDLQNMLVQLPFSDVQRLEMLYHIRPPETIPKE